MRPKVIAKVLLVNGAGELLCLTRSKRDDARPGEWDFPGGSLKVDESPIAANPARGNRRNRLNRSRPPTRIRDNRDA